MFFAPFLLLLSLFSTVFAGRSGSMARRAPALLDTRADVNVTAGADVTVCVVLTAGTRIDTSLVTEAEVRAQVQLLGLISLNVDVSAVGKLPAVTLDVDICLCARAGVLVQSSLSDLDTRLRADTEVTAVVTPPSLLASVLNPVTLNGAVEVAITGIQLFLNAQRSFNNICPNNPAFSTQIACGECAYNCDSGYERCGGKCVKIGTCPSGVPRVRRRALNADLMCSNGLTACAVPGRKGKTECMNTASDVESCGGCEFPLEGREKGLDCTAIANVDAVSCLGGRCLVRSCRKGFVAVGNECVAR